MAIILGIWDGHDAGAVLIKNGEVLGAMNEERLSRRKLEVGFPRESISFLLRHHGVSASEISAVGACTYDFSKTLTRVFPSLKERYYLLRRRKVAPGFFLNFKRKIKYFLTVLPKSKLTYKVSSTILRRNLERMGIVPENFEIFDHHDCHAMGAASASGFSEGLVLTMDGVGDEASSKSYLWKNGELDLLTPNHALHSLGIFFEQVTFALNLRELEDEGKVMALANFSANLKGEENPFEDFFKIDGMSIKASHRPWRQMDLIRQALWRFPSEQIAYFAQNMLERKVLQWTKNALKLTGESHLIYSGGVAANIKVNALLRSIPGVKDFFVFPHMGDGGLAYGAAILLGKKLSAPPPGKMSSPFLGPAYTSEEIESSARAHPDLNFTETSYLANDAAEQLMQGEILFWFQGRMEYGPRALGARSILGLPGNTALKDRLNLVLKKRVWYQPFCPSMLESEATRVLENFEPRELRWMTTSYRVKDEFREAMAGVTNIDGTCRPQIVRDEETGAFANLLRELKRKAGFGVLLNTSLNLHGEPLVCSPEDAFRTFKQCNVDHLFIENLHFSKVPRESG